MAMNVDQLVSTDNGVAGLSPSAAARVASLPPVSVLFAAFLGYNPMQSLLGPALGTLSPARQAAVTGHAFFPSLISGPFHHGLSIVFTFALVMCLIAAAASWLRGSGASDTGTGTVPAGDLATREIVVSEPETATALAQDPRMITEADA